MCRCFARIIAAMSATDSPSPANTLSPVAAPPTVYLASTSSEGSCWLAQQLSHYLAEHMAAEAPAFVLQACSPAQLQHLPLAAEDAVLLIVPPLPANPIQDNQAQAQLMRTRLQLADQGQAFQLLFSQGQRLKQEALAAICNWFPKATALQALRAALRETGQGSGERWGCEKCSDPACELRLFQDLFAPQKA